MTQRKSSDDHTRARALGRRIRDLRGDASQADFAKRIGVSRSALANYELGRSTAPDDLIRKINELFGVVLSDEPELPDFEAELKRIGGDGAQPTEDEWALVRVLRVADPEDVRNLISDLVARVEKNSASVRLGDPETTARDLVRLIMIASGKVPYRAGTSGSNLIQLARAIARQIKA